MIKTHVPQKQTSGPKNQVWITFLALGGSGTRFGFVAENEEGRDGGNR